MESLKLDGSLNTHNLAVSSDMIDEIKNSMKDQFIDICDNDISPCDNIDDAYAIVESYFGEKKLKRLVRHQLESYNHFILHQIEKTIEMFNPVPIRSENDYVKETDKYTLEILINFDNFKLYSPQIHENNGATKTMLPQEAKSRNFTYASIMTVDVNIKYIIRNTENMDEIKIIEKNCQKLILVKCLS